MDRSPTISAAALAAVFHLRSRGSGRARGARRARGRHRACGRRPDRRGGAGARGAPRADPASGARAQPGAAGIPRADPGGACARGRRRAAARPRAQVRAVGGAAATPLSLNRAGMLMLGLRQSFPALGTRAARGRMADEEAAALDDGQRARERDLMTQVRRAYGQYWRAEHEYRVHQEHVGLLGAHRRAVARPLPGRSRVAAGSPAPHRGAVAVAHRRRESRARAAVEPRAAQRADGARPRCTARSTTRGGDPRRLRRRGRRQSAAPAADLDARRPEVVSATRVVRRGEAALDLRAASGAVAVADGRRRLLVHADARYAARLRRDGVDQPALAERAPPRRDRRGGARAGGRSARAGGATKRGALRAARRRARVAAAVQAVRIIDDDLLPQARRSYESAEAAYQSGQSSALALLDALRAYLQVRLERSRALARFDASRADYDRAAGIAEREADAP